MKKFILKTIIISFPVFLGLIVLEFFYLQVPNNYNYKSAYLDKNVKDIEVLVLGSSHAFLGVKSICFDYKTFNCAEYSQSLDYDYRIFNKYKRDYKNLKVVVIPISYFSLWSKLEQNQNFRLLYYVQSYGFINKKTSIKDILYGEHKFKWKVRRLVKYYFSKKTAIECDKLGWIDKEKGIDEKEEGSESLVEIGRYSASRHDKIMSDENYNDNVNYLKSIISWCNNHNVKVLLFTPPAYVTYRNALRKEYVNKIFETSKELVSEYNNCQYFNYLSDTTFQIRDFYDVDHLNRFGAEKLSRKLNNIIISN